MKIIFLKGPSHSGKTTTLMQLYEQLKSDGARDLLPVRRCPRSGNDEEYYVSFNDKKIGIVTMGDSALETILYIGIFLERGADILVIANSNKEFPCAVVNWHKGEMQEVIVEKVSIADVGKVQEIMSHL